MNLTERQREVLKYIFENTTLCTFNVAIREYNLQRIYTMVENKLSANLFNNDKLRSSVFVADLFNQFQTQSQELRSKEIKNEMTKLELDIKFKARYKRNYYTELGKFNELRDEYRLLNKSIEQFRKLYKKYKK